MKSKLLAIALLSAGLTASAQNNERKLSVTKAAEWNYTVGRDGRSWNGLASLKNLSNNNLWVRGSYTNNARTGTWYFFDGKENLSMRYSYDQKKVLFLDPKSLQNVLVKVLSDDAEVAKNASVPLPLCPIDFYVNLIGNKIYAENHDSANENSTAEITAHVDATGKATYTVAYLSKDKKTIPVEIDLSSVFPIEWVPSSYQDKKIPSEFVVYATLNNFNVDNGSRRFRWDN